MTDYGIALLMLSAMAFVPAGMSAYLVEERSKQEKRVQLTAGVAVHTYWLCAFLWDMFIILILMAMSIGIIVAFSVPSYTDNENLPAVTLLLLTYLTCSAALTYIMEKMFNEPSVAQLVILSVNFLSGLICLLTTLLLESLYDNQFAQDLNYYLRRAFLVLPPYAFGAGMMETASNQISSDLYSAAGMEGEEYDYVAPLTWDIVGINIFVLSIETLIFLFLNLCMEMGWFSAVLRRMCFKKVPQPLEDEDEEEDVRLERQRVDEIVWDDSETLDDAILVKGLTKVFGGYSRLTFWKEDGDGAKVAVNNVSVGIKKGEASVFFKQINL